MDKYEYLGKLKQLHDRIPNGFEQKIFFILCKRYQDYTKGLMQTKSITKEEIIKYLIDKDIMKMSIDKKTGDEKLPDDRPIRHSVRKLMKNGLPILSSSSNAGYYICDNVKEIEQPYNENKKRALSILARQKGFEIMTQYINGQIDITDIDLTDEIDLD